MTKSSHFVYSTKGCSAGSCNHCNDLNQAFCRKSLLNICFFLKNASFVFSHKIIIVQKYCFKYMHMIYWMVSQFDTKYIIKSRSFDKIISNYEINRHIQINNDIWFKIQYISILLISYLCFKWFRSGNISSYIFGYIIWIYYIET